MYVCMCVCVCVCEQELGRYLRKYSHQVVPHSGAGDASLMMSTEALKSKIDIVDKKAQLWRKRTRSEVHTPNLNPESLNRSEVYTPRP